MNENGDIADMSRTCFSRSPLPAALVFMRFHSPLWDLGIFFSYFRERESKKGENIIYKGIRAFLPPKIPKLSAMTAQRLYSCAFAADVP